MVKAGPTGSNVYLVQPAGTPPSGCHEFDEFSLADVGISELFAAAALASSDGGAPKMESPSSPTRGLEDEQTMRTRQRSPTGHGSK